MVVDFNSVVMTLAYGCCNEEDEASADSICLPSRLTSSRNPYRARASSFKVMTPTKIKGTSPLETPPKPTAEERRAKQMAGLAAGRAILRKKREKCTKDNADSMQQEQGGST
jgi:hypothetical protein